MIERRINPFLLTLGIPAIIGIVFTLIEAVVRRVFPLGNIYYVFVGILCLGIIIAIGFIFFRRISHGRAMPAIFITCGILLAYSLFNRLLITVVIESGAYEILEVLTFIGAPFRLYGSVGNPVSTLFREVIGLPPILMEIVGRLYILLPLVYLIFTKPKEAFAQLVSQQTQPAYAQQPGQPAPPWAQPQPGQPQFPQQAPAAPRYPAQPAAPAQTMPAAPQYQAQPAAPVQTTPATVPIPPEAGKE